LFLILGILWLMHFFRLFRIHLKILVFSVIILPFTIIDDTLNTTYKNIWKYEQYQSAGENDKLTLQKSKPYYYAELQLKYKGISLEDLQKNIQIYYYLIIFYNIIAFLLIWGIIEMIMVSFYKRELTHK
jgi:hypothetical protein